MHRVSIPRTRNRRVIGSRNGQKRLVKHGPSAPDGSLGVGREELEDRVGEEDETCHEGDYVR